MAFKRSSSVGWAAAFVGKGLGGAREVWKRRLPFWQNCFESGYVFYFDTESRGTPKDPPLKFVTKSLVVFLLVACTVFCTVFSDGSSEAAKSEE